VFVVYAKDDVDAPLIYSAPVERLDFDSTHLPEPVQRSLEEAAACFSQGCFVAAAIMIRKTLEEVCKEREATGSNLRERLAALGERVVLPEELLVGMDALRLLGNDAAHFESQTFNQVGREEVEVSFEVVKELLKGVYQYRALISQLHALRRQQDGGTAPVTE
jgi:hypothetical protein